MQKRVIPIIILVFLLVGFVTAGITGSVTLNSNEGKNNNSNNSAIQNSVQTQNSGENSQIQAHAQTRSRELSEYKARVIRRIQNRLQANADPSNCPNGCTCTGSVTKCQTQDGREMIIRAGKSGNTVIQVKGENMTTKVELYRAEGKIYGVFKNNKTKAIEIMPDEVKERIRQRIKARLENQTIELDEDGNYKIQIRKKARLFGLIPIRERVRMQMDPETGEIIKIKNPWWSFLTKDIEEE